MSKMNPSLRLKFKGLPTSLIMLAIAALFAVLLSCDRIYAADSAFTGVTQSGATTSSVDIRFKPGSQSSGNRYTALIGTSKTGDFSETGVITALNSLTLTDLKDGSTYYIKIASCDEEGMLTGEESQPFAVVTAPGGTPSYISQSESGVDSVTVVWAPVSGATGYYVEYSLADSTTGSKERMSVSSESATIKGILSSKVYSVTVYPYRSSGAFTAFDKATAVTLGNVAIRDQGTGGTPTGRVTGLKQTGAESDKVTVSFNPLIDKNAEYAIFLSERSTTGFTAYARTKESPFTIENLTPGKTYYIKVAPCYLTYSSLNETYIPSYGEYSDVCEIVTTPGSAPTSLKQTVIKKKLMTLTWSNVSGATGYVVEYYESGVSDSKKSVTVKTNTVTLKKLKEGEAYTVYVTPFRKAASGYVAMDSKSYAYRSNLPLKPAQCSKPVVKSIYKSLKKLTVSTKAMNSADGYEYQLWADGKDSSGKRVSGKICKVDSDSYASCNIKEDIIASADTAGLKVRVRAYINIGGKKVYGKWSDYTKI